MLVGLLTSETHVAFRLSLRSPGSPGLLLYLVGKVLQWDLYIKVPSLFVNIFTHKSITNERLSGLLTELDRASSVKEQFRIYSFDSIGRYVALFRIS